MRVAARLNSMYATFEAPCMKGSIGYAKHVKRYFVRWYDPAKKQTVKIYKYKGIYLETRKLAEKLLAAMQGDVENGAFRLEKFTRGETDVMPYLRKWLESVKHTLTPATYKDYGNSIRNHLAPFFERKGICLHEIEYDILVELLGSINREGKGKLNVMYCLRACLDFAWRSRRIPAVPPFPQKKDYQIVERPIRWLPSARQEAVIRAIPEEHQPIFWFLKYHLRRPSEACAMLKEDYDGSVFTIHRGFSAKVPVDRTKTGETHNVPVVSDFLPLLDIERRKQHQAGIVSPYFFVNQYSRKAGKHYTLITLERIWHRACAQVGEDIGLYSGLKHSTASQLINEDGRSIHEVQMATDHARLESVRKYAKVEVSAKRAILERLRPAGTSWPETGTTKKKSDQENQG
jgi:integrase